HRSGGVLRLMMSAIAAGFLLYVLTQMSTALGLSGSVPAAIAAWSPATIAALVALWSLLRAEEG
ncbi:MAG: LptF/LptG family permease, partial [Parvularculaceae bacterium]|nr:LptF/LptG family permease [Parvularculaceae bacterium]